MLPGLDEGEQEPVTGVLRFDQQLGRLPGVESALSRRPRELVYEGSPEAEEGGHRFGQRQLEPAAAEAVVGRQGRGLLQPGQCGLGIVGVQMCEERFGDRPAQVAELGHLLRLEP